MVPVLSKKRSRFDDKAIQVKPNLELAWHYRGMALYLLHRHQEAIAVTFVVRLWEQDSTRLLTTPAQAALDATDASVREAKRDLFRCSSQRDLLLL